MPAVSGLIEEFMVSVILRIRGPKPIAAIVLRRTSEKPAMLPPISLAHAAVCPATPSASLKFATRCGLRPMLSRYQP